MEWRCSRYKAYVVDSCKLAIQYCNTQRLQMKQSTYSSHSCHQSKNTTTHSNISLTKNEMQKLEARELPKNEFSLEIIILVSKFVTQSK